MCRIRIELNKDKISREAIYPYDKMVSSLDTICKDTNFIKAGPGEYSLDKDADSIGSLLVLISRFESQSWLIPNIRTWTVINDDGIEEDALKTYMMVRNAGIA
ncbi:MAG: hypothetical protein IKS84_01365 [Lachnospiraceae bacterium]|nr:hypothetical protein [Lachnospiraceae bacterium]MBR6487266.1 hypothetical protein [Lachnospiraceae bacterium]